MESFEAQGWNRKRKRVQSEFKSSPADSKWKSPRVTESLEIECAVCGATPSRSHHFMSCPLNLCPLQDLKKYAECRKLTEQKRIPGGKGRLVQSALDDTRFVMFRAFRNVTELHDAGFSLDRDFDASNFLIQMNDLSVYLDGVERRIKAVNKWRRQRDFRRFAHMIRREFFADEAVPEDVVQWLDMMNEFNFSEEEEEEELQLYVLKYHHSLMDRFTWASVLMSIFDKLCQIREEDPGYFNCMVEGIKGYSDWQSNLMNGYSQQTYEYRNPSTGNTTQYTDDVMGVISMLRNTRSHSAQFKEEEFALIVQNDFPLLLNDLQLHMSRAKCLSFLKLEHRMR